MTSLESNNPFGSELHMSIEEDMGERVVWFSKGFSSLIEVRMPASDRRSERMVYEIWIDDRWNEFSTKETIDRLSPLFDTWEEGQEVAVRILLATKQFDSKGGKRTYPDGVIPKWFHPSVHPKFKVLDEQKAQSIHRVQRELYNAIVSQKRRDPLFSYEMNQADRLSRVSFYSGGTKGTLSCSFHEGAWHVTSSLGHQLTVSSPEQAKPVIHALFDVINEQNRVRELLDPTFHHFHKHAFGYAYTEEKRKNLLAQLLRTMEAHEIERVFHQKHVVQFEHPSYYISCLRIGDLYAVSGIRTQEVLLYSTLHEAVEAFEQEVTSYQEKDRQKVMNNLFDTLKG